MYTLQKNIFFAIYTLQKMMFYCTFLVNKIHSTSNERRFLETSKTNFLAFSFCPIFEVQRLKQRQLVFMSKKVLRRLNYYEDYTLLDLFFHRLV